MALYNWVRKELPDAGAQQYAFYSNIQDPLYSLPGPGTPYAFIWNVYQPPQVYLNQSTVLTGLAGVVSGQMANPALLDTRGIAGANG